MNIQASPAIVIAAFNRPKSLNRLLSSLDRSIISEQVPLVISIDNNGMNGDVVQIAESYKWNYGPKKVIYHKERLGLRNHILKCGDLSEQYGSVIVLEDDVFVSPYFYSFSLNAMKFYQNDDKIGGISLYNQPYTESVKLPFIPIKGKSDVYFMQIASSYGQLWTSNQWSSFKKWLDANPNVERISGLPSLIKKWPETSWKKHFCGYLVASDKYFVFPQVSYTTNFSDPGSNFVYRNHFGQIQIDITEQENKFEHLADSVSVYDAYSELSPDVLKKLAGGLDEYDFEVDLYGKKEEFTKDFVITCKKCKNPILGFEKSMKPQEFNIIFNVKGDDIHLVRTIDIEFYPRTLNELLYNRNVDEFIKEFSYYHINIFSTELLMKVLKDRIVKKVRAVFIRKN